MIADDGDIVSRADIFCEDEGASVRGKQPGQDVAVERWSGALSIAIFTSYS